MAILSFNFSGWCRADITKAFDITKGKDIDVSKMSAEELADKLNNGELAINFTDVYEDAGSVENAVTDFTPVEEGDDIQEE
jgi:hypothetical protein